MGQGCRFQGHSHAHCTPTPKQTGILLTRLWFVEVLVLAAVAVTAATKAGKATQAEQQC
jgi:hypothetical protein